MTRLKRSDEQQQGYQKVHASMPCLGIVEPHASSLEGYSFLSIIPLHKRFSNMWEEDEDNNPYSSPGGGKLLPMHHIQSNTFKQTTIAHSRPIPPSPLTMIPLPNMSTARLLSATCPTTTNDRTTFLRPNAVGTRVEWSKRCTKLPIPS